jgi:hypothetical protein
MLDEPPSIPFADSRSDRESRHRKFRRVAKARLSVTKDILALLEEREKDDANLKIDDHA